MLLGAELKPAGGVRSATSGWPWLWPVGFGAVYFLLALLGSWLTVSPHPYVTFWLPSGFYLGALLLASRKHWPLLVLSALAANLSFDLTHGQPWIAALGFATGNTLEALAGAWLVQRFVSPRPTLGTVREVIGVLGLAGLFSTTLSASLGAGVVTAVLTGELYWPTWLTWWSSDLMGILLVAPVLLAGWPALSTLRRPPAPRHWLSSSILASLVGATIWLEFNHSTFPLSPRKFLLFPFVSWAAVQFGPPGASLATFLIGLTVAGSGRLGYGLPADASPYEYTLLLNLFLAVLSLTGLITAAAFNERLLKARNLQRSEQRYRELVESTAALAWRMDVATGRWTYIAPQVEMLLGYPPAEWTDLAWWIAHLHPEDRQWAPDHCRGLTAEGRDHAFDYRFIAKDGRTVWIHSVVHVVLENEQPVALHGVMVDITERKQAELALRESEYWLNASQRVSRLGSYNLDVASGNWLSTPSLDAIFGIGADYPKNVAGWVALLHPEHRAEMADYLLEEVIGRGQRFDREYRIVRADDGATRWVHGLGELALDPAGQPIRITGTIQDITERKLAEQEMQALYEQMSALNEELVAANEELRSANAETASAYQSLMDTNAELERSRDEISSLSERNQAILASVPDIIMEVDANQVYTWANQAGLEFFGDGVLGREAADFFAEHQDTYQQVAPLFAGDESVFYVESWQRRRDGAKRLLAWWCRVLKDARGQVSGALSAAQDITEYRQAERALRESEERLRLALQAAQQGLYDLNIQTGVAEVSPEYATMLGYAPAEFHETNAQWLARLHPADRERVTATFQAYIRGELPEYSVEFRQRTKTGEWKWILSLGKIVAYDEHGEPLRMLGTHTDITERKLAVEELRRSAAFLDQTFDRSPLPQWISDEQGTLIKLNQALRDLLQITDAEVVGKYNVLQDNIVTQQGCMPQVRAVFERGATARFPLRWRTSELSQLDLAQDVEVVLDVTISPLLDSAGRVTNAIIQHTDITERTLYEEALRQSEEQYRTLFEQARDAIIIADAATGLVLQCNRMAEHLLDRPRDEIIGMHQTALHPPEQRAHYADLWSEHVHAPASPPAEATVYTSAGREIPVEINSSLITLADGRQALLGIFRDISERLKAKAALQTERGHIQRILDTVQTMIVSLDTEGRITLINPKGCALLGYEADELMGRNWFETCLPQSESSPTAVPVFHEIIAGRLAGAEYFENEVITRDGQRRLMAWHNSALYDTAGKITGLLSAGEDITDRRQAEIALRESEERLATIFQHSPAWQTFVRLDTQQTVDVNEEWCRLIGYTREEAIGRSPVELGIYDQATMDRIIAELQSGRTAKGIEVVATNRCGEQRVLLASRELINLRGQPHLLSMGIDITERQQAEAALRESEKKYRELFANAGEAIFVAQDGKLVFHNPQTAVMLGWSSAEIGDQPFTAFIHPADQALVLERHRQRLHGAHPPANYEFRVVTADGAERWVDLTTVLIEWNGRLATLNFMLDITDQRNARQALAHSEQRYRMLFQNMSPGFALHEIITDAQGRPCDYRFLEVNPAFERLTGLKAAELIGRTVLDALPGTELSWIETYGRVAMTGEAARLEDYSQELGRFYDVLAYSPEPGQFATILSDITERKRTEEALKHNEQFLRAVVGNSPLGISVRSKTGRLLSYNEAWQRIWAIPDEEVQLDMSRERPRLALDARDEYSRPWWSELERVYRDGGTFTIPEARTTRKRPGMAEWVSQVFYAIPDATGQVDRVVVVTQDITQRKRAEAALRQSEEKFAKAFQSSPDAILISALADGRIVEVNEGFTVLTGYSREDVMNRTALEVGLWDDPADRARCVTALQDHGQVRDLEVSFRTITGGVLTCLYSGVLIQLDGSTHMLSIVRDITERKQAEAALRQLELQLMQAQKMEIVGRLAGGVAHDFNNKLQLILGFSELASDDAPEHSRLAEQLREIQTAASGSADLTRQLLAFARQQAVAPKVINLNDTIDGMLKMLRRLIGEEIELVWKPGPALHSVLIDPVQVDQILANLAVNARDSIAGIGQITLETRNVDLDADFCRMHVGCLPGPYVELAVVDTGAGMDEVVRAHIFEPFYTTKPAGQGTGLGLSTVYGIVQQNAGILTVDSEVGQGSTFRVLLPQASSQTVATGAASTRLDLPVGTETIIIVEDEAIVLRLASQFLSLQGYNTIHAHDPEECLRIVREYAGPVHLLVTDVVMPVMNGRELAARVQGLRPGLKTLFMSGYTADVISKHGVLEAGMEFIQKPFSRTELAVKVRQVLDG